MGGGAEGNANGGAMGNAITDGVKAWKLLPPSGLCGGGRAARCLIFQHPEAFWVGGGVQYTEQCVTAVVSPLRGHISREIANAISLQMHACPK